MKARRLSRRDFLNGTLLGVAGLAARGAGASLPWQHLPGLTADSGNLPPATGGWSPFELCHDLVHGQTWNLPPASGNALDCVILGGGISGLAAAWRLLRAGFDDILILEKNDRVGGQCRSIAGETTGLAAQGSAYASIPYTEVLTDLYTDLGFVVGTNADGSPVIDESLLLRPPWARHFIGGAWYEDPWTSEAALNALPFPPEIVADLRTFREKVSWWYDFVGADGKPAFASPIDGASRDPEVLWLERQSLSEYVASEGLDAAVSEFFDPLVRSVFGLSPASLSAYVAVDFLTGEILPGDESVLCQPGGNAFIADAMAGLIGASRIRTNAFVLGAVNAQGEVHVSFLEDGQAKTIRARTAIFACPRMMAPYLLPDLGQRPEENNRFQYAAYLVANVHVSETPPDLAYANEVHGDFFFTDFTVADWAGLEDPVHAPLSRPNTLTVYAPLTAPDSRRMIRTTPIEEFEQAVFDDLERVLPGITDIATGFDLFRWGHPLVQATPGFVFSDDRVAAKEPVGRIFFAGHETEGIPYIDTAITAGARAADEAGTRLVPRARRTRRRVP